MSDNNSTPQAVWPILTYRDARAAVEFLSAAFGFEPIAVYARDDDPSVVEHAELRRPLGGGVMFGTVLADRGTDVWASSRGGVHVRVLSTDGQRRACRQLSRCGVRGDRVGRLLVVVDEGGESVENTAEPEAVRVVGVVGGGVCVAGGRADP